MFFDRADASSKNPMLTLKAFSKLAKVRLQRSETTPAQDPLVETFAQKIVAAMRNGQQESAASGAKD